MILLFASASFMAEAADRLGMPAVVIDYFADSDSRRLAPVIRLAADHSQRQLTDAVGMAARKFGANLITYGSPLERRPDLLQKLGDMVEIAGNCYRAIRSLQKPGAFFNEVRRLKGNHPQTSAVRPQNPEGWLVKNRGAGGMGIAYADNYRETGKDLIYQRLTEGTPLSLNFLAAEGKVLPLVLSHSTTAPTDKKPFRLGGFVAESWNEDGENLLRLARGLADKFELRGINTLDAIRDKKGELCVLELNPRPGAALRLMPPAARGKALGWHIKGCLEGKLPPAADARRLKAAARGRLAVLYAGRSLQMPRVPRPPWATDWPMPGESIAADAPICVVKARSTAELNKRSALTTALLGL